MCGIACIIRKGGQSSEPNAVSAMLELLRHRGPDDSGAYASGPVALGMTRLSILDLVSPGLCPYVYSDPSDSNRRAAIAFNGEIFNYREVREELRELGWSFETTGDTEVLLKSYLQWGSDCLERFNGMFAFVIYDEIDDLVFAARDIAGEKPLYYTETGTEIVFASEIKAILAATGLPEIHLTDEYRAFEYMTGSDTMFTGIHSFLPAQRMIIRNVRMLADSPRLEEYWDVPARIHAVPEDSGDLVNHLDALLQDSVAMRLRSDVPTGLYLSGGIDSAILAYMARPKIVFSVQFREGDSYDELRYAELVARDIGAEHVVIRPTKEDFERDLDSILYHLDMPVGSFSAFPLFCLAREASKRVKVILSGEGADELFSGYTRYLLPYHDEQAYAIPELSAYRSLLDFYYRTPLDRVARLLNRGLVPDEVVRQVIAPYFNRFDDIRHAMGYAEFKLMLVTLLHMEDRMASAFGLENRSPFLDKRIIAFAYSIPGDMKIRGATTKYIVKEVARRYIPSEILARREKLGLIAPINLWMNFRGARGEFDRSSYNELCRARWRQVFFEERWQERGGTRDSKLHSQLANVMRRSDLLVSERTEIMIGKPE